jgi:Ser-tRNA(Ala) deacylase AlaX
MNQTKLKYLENFSLLELEAVVADILKEDERDVVVLDETVFYPQGGGQPYDTGIMESVPGAKFVVEEVRYVDGLVKHIGKFESGIFQKGETVKCFVDADRRKLNSRLHSAGHLVDMVVTELNLGWTPGKGYHFPQGPYVEYIGSLNGLDREKLKFDIESVGNKLVRQGAKTSLVFMPKEEMKSVCHFVPEYLPEGKPGRVVMYGDFGVPCGGTHVTNLSEIGHFTVRKIKQEGVNIRIGYDVEK